MIFRMKDVTPEALEAGNKDCFDAIIEAGKAEMQATITEKDSAHAESMEIIKHGQSVGQVQLALELVGTPKDQAITQLNEAKATLDAENLAAFSSTAAAPAGHSVSGDEIEVTDHKSALAHVKSKYGIQGRAAITRAREEFPSVYGYHISKDGE